jgi:signal transduction histidine kinase
LKLAAERILDRRDEIGGVWMVSRDDAADTLRLLSERVKAIRSGTVERNFEMDLERQVLHHRLSDALRSELLGQWKAIRSGSAQGNPEEILDVLSVIEEYRSLLRRGAQDDLVGRMSEPDALTLVVEVAHDLRSPLNSILFLSEVLRSGYSGPVNERQQSQLGLMYSAALRMTSVMNDMMVAASDGKGILDEGVTPFAIGTIFASVRDLVQPMAEEKGIGLEFEVPDYDHCICLQSALGRVLLNLTTNALKFTEKGKVVVSAKRLDREHLEFSVLDAGRGIPEDYWEKLFQPFQKSADRSGHYFAPSGLGLSIVRRLVRAMGSELRLESELGVGTRFFFSLHTPLP